MSFLLAAKPRTVATPVAASSRNTSKRLRRLSLSCGGALLFSAAAMLVTPSATAAEFYDDSNILIPQMGTAGALGISVQREKAIGDFFLRTARANLPVIDDPVLNEYVTSLGNRLLSHADNVQFPFDFFVVKNNDLNASAFLGGKVVINTGLFNYASTEDEFASVLAHEISHVTQRHIARFVEKMTMANRLSTAGVVGSIVMAILNPAVGLAAMSTTMGASMQSGINFTRDNEYEADRIGITLLYRAGLNPQGMVDMFRYLNSQQGNINPAFTLLIDHPLSDVRMAEAQNRVAQFEHRPDSTNPDYQYARARVAVRYTMPDDEKSLRDFKQGLKHNARGYTEYYQNYALALVCYELKEYDEAAGYLRRLPQSQQSNLFVLDLFTDIDIARGQPQQAVARLQPFYKRTPRNQVIVANLASAYNENMQYSRARDLLVGYLRYKPKDVLALNLLATTYTKLKNQCDTLQTRGEVYALSAAYPQAMGMFNQALQTCTEMLTRERIKARVSELVTQRSFDESLLR